MIITDLINLSS